MLVDPKSTIKASVTNDFKMGIVIVIFLVTFFHLLEVSYFPNTAIVSNEILLGIVLAAIAYLWIQEVSDRRKLFVINDELITAHDKLKESNIATMKALIMSEEARDAYTSGHSKRVTEYAVAIASNMNMNEDERRHIEYAGYLHDIGKIGISDAILNKESRLDDSEWAVIKKHPAAAIEILNPLTFLPVEKVIIMHHHERYDGTGYPSGLKGEDIPLGARIMAVADSFDAMNSRRSYRPPLSEEKIISELKSAKGTQLDPKIVDVFLDIVKSNTIIFQVASEAR